MPGRPYLSCPGRAGLLDARALQSARDGWEHWSTLEVTSRLRRLIRYTKFCPVGNRLPGSTNREDEVQVLLERFRFHHCSSSVSFLPDPDIQAQVAAGFFSGGRVGTILKSHFGSHTDLLHTYDQELRRLRLPHFSATVSWPTRIDWSIFTCYVHR